MHVIAGDGNPTTLLLKLTQTCLNSDACNEPVTVQNSLCKVHCAIPKYIQSMQLTCRWRLAQGLRPGNCGGLWTHASACCQRHIYMCPPS